VLLYQNEMEAWIHESKGVCGRDISLIRTVAKITLTAHLQMSFLIENRRLDTLAKVALTGEHGNQILVAQSLLCTP